MCGRYVNKLIGEAVFSFFEVNDIRIAWRPRYNVAPTTEVPVIRLAEEGFREVVGMRWGLRPFWAKPDAKLPLMINARAETIAEKPAYRAAFKKRRCLVPASGYYEWQQRGKGPKQPWFFERKDGFPIAFAGIWEAGLEDHPETVSIITTTPNQETAEIHDRMPVILRRRFWKRWFEPMPLSDEERRDILIPAPDGSLALREVSTAVNSVSNDDPTLID